MTLVESGPSTVAAAVAALEPDYEQLERAAFFDEERRQGVPADTEDR